MKKLIFLVCLLIFQIQARAQFFSNVNSELCYLLYVSSDAAGKFSVYMVIDQDDFTSKDSLQLVKWKSLNSQRRKEFIGQWINKGKRIESERGDIIMNPPTFIRKRFFVPQPMRRP